MSQFIDLTGMHFNRLTVLEKAHINNGRQYWKCLCDCGNITYVSGGNIRSGMVKSCGCLRHEQTYITHQKTGTRLYSVWNGIKMRCCNEHIDAYKNYGGRGIKICEEWKDKPDQFFEWALANGYSDNLTIERKNVDGDYCPDNCTWIPKADQAKNRRSNYKISYDGKTQDMTDWCNELNLPYKLVHNRMSKLGWSFERAISEPCHIEKRNKTMKG